jgi:Rrf2 family protein
MKRSEEVSGRKADLRFSSFQYSEVGELMAGTSVQFAVATHIMTALGFHYGKDVTSGALATSVNTDPTFVRKALSRLAKAGLVVSTRGKNGHCSLARPPEQITLKDIYIASEAPAPFAIHGYPVEKTCPISSNIKGCMSVIQEQTQIGLQASLSGITLASVVAQIRQRQTSQVTGDTES